MRVILGVRRGGRFLVALALVCVPLVASLGEDGGPHRAASLMVAGPQRAVAATPSQSGLTFLKTVFTTQGNAAHVVWSDDGKSVFLANEEGAMPAVKIDASSPRHPRIAATGHRPNYLWGVDQRRGLLVFSPTIGNAIARYDPASFTLQWMVKLPTTHSIATDGSHVYVAGEGTPGTLIVLDASGAILSRTRAPDAWSEVYGTVYAADTQRVFVAGKFDPAHGAPGGIYIYGVSGPAPVFLGKISESASDIAVAGGRLWTHNGPSIEAWDVSNPAHPTRVGVWTAPGVWLPGHSLMQVVFGGLAVNAAGTRLYAAYGHILVQGEIPVPNAPAGFMIFDVSGATPRLVASEDWIADGTMRKLPLTVALSPDGTTLAVSYFRFGVQLFRVADDATTSLGRVATTGEAHDVYVDARGILYVFDNDNLEIIDPRSGRHLQDIPVFDIGDGGWKPFRDGNVVARGRGPTVLGLRGGTIAYRQMLPILGTYIWDNAFDDPYLYSGGQNGTLYVQRIAVTGSGQYTATVVGSVKVPRVPGVSSGVVGILAVAKRGTLVWVLGPGVGLAAIDVSRPAAPSVVFHDAFTFPQNGHHVGLVVVRGRVYAGAGARGVLIYDPATFRRTGVITGLNANFLDTIGENYLIVANYWYAGLPDGVYVYDLRGDPDSPLLAGHFPAPLGNANFRARVVGTTSIYRVPLYGVDLLSFGATGSPSAAIVPAQPAK